MAKTSFSTSNRDGVVIRDMRPPRRDSLLYAPYCRGAARTEVAIREHAGRNNEGSRRGSHGLRALSRRSHRTHIRHLTMRLLHDIDEQRLWHLGQSNAQRKHQNQDKRQAQGRGRENSLQMASYTSTRTTPVSRTAEMKDFRCTRNARRRTRRSSSASWIASDPLSMSRRPRAASRTQVLSRA